MDAAKPLESLRFEPLAAPYVPWLQMLELEAYPEPWTPQMLYDEINNTCGYFCLMFLGNEPVGYGGFWLLVDEAHITRVTVVPSRRGQGLGCRLMHHLLSTAVERGAAFARLEVRASNHAAIRLYRNLGFMQEGVRFGYYRTNEEDALVMSLSLEGDNQG